MLTLIALSAALLQDPPAPPAPPAPPEVRTRFMVMGPDGAGRLDADGDGQVSREEFSAPMNDAFGRMDKDGDGRLSTEELASSHGGEHGATFIRGPEGPGGPGVRHFEIHREGAGHEGGTWTSSDGERTMVFVGRGEPGAGGAREIVIEGEGSPRVIQLPHGADGPGEHRIEIRRMGGEGGQQDLDKDNDGKISEAEFTAPLREAFGRMDADRSGFIEEGERGGDGEVRVFTHRIETRRDNEN